MGGILDKLKGLLSSIPNISNKGLSMKLIVGYLIILGIACVTYLTGWFYQWIILGILRLSELKDIIVVFSNPSFVAAIGTLALLLVDRDGDGMSDELENKLDINERKPDNKGLN